MILLISNFIEYQKEIGIGGKGSTSERIWI